jgi:hypothetical protein
VRYERFNLLEPWSFSRADKKERTISPAKSMTKRQALQVSLKIGYLAYDALQVTDDI